jgi:hypothetical protein
MLKQGGKGGKRGLDVCDAGYGSFAAPCEHGNERAGSGRDVQNAGSFLSS